MALWPSDFKPDKPRLALVVGLIAALAVPAIGFLLWSTAHDDKRGESLAITLIIASFSISGGLAFFISSPGQTREGMWLVRLFGISMSSGGVVLLFSELPWRVGPVVLFLLIALNAGIPLLLPVLAVFAQSKLLLKTRAFAALSYIFGLGLMILGFVSLTSRVGQPWIFAVLFPLGFVANMFAIILSARGLISRTDAMNRDASVPPV
jgi:hypothetical protein